MRPCIFAPRMAPQRIVTTLLLAASLPLFSLKATASEQLHALIQQALQADPAQQQFDAQANALLELGVAAAQLPDPKLKVGLGNLPLDEFDLDSDPMTQLSVGLMQSFGRGDTLTLKQHAFNQQAAWVNAQADERRLQLQRTLHDHWISLHLVEHTEILQQAHRTLLIELANYIETSYGLGSKTSQDLLRAQLQISKLDEQLAASRQRQQQLRAKLSEWVVLTSLPKQTDTYPQWPELNTYLNRTHSHEAQLQTHPRFIQQDRVIARQQTQLAIADEAYQPQFGLELKYAHRQAERMGGASAPDLLSVFVSMDLPLFTEQRQDRRRSAAYHQLSAAQTQRVLLLQQMQAQLEDKLAMRNQLQDRLQRYQDTLLPQAQARTHALELGYQHNSNDLEGLLNALREELVLQLEQARLQAQRHRSQNQLAYLLNLY